MRGADPNSRILLAQSLGLNPDSFAQPLPMDSTVVVTSGALIPWGGYNAPNNQEWGANEHPSYDQNSQLADGHRDEYRWE